jgi:hypothetical protein
MEDFSMQPSSLPFNAVVLGLSPDQFHYSELNQAFLILMQVGFRSPAFVLSYHHRVG